MATIIYLKNTIIAVFGDGNVECCLIFVAKWSFKGKKVRLKNNCPYYLKKDILIGNSCQRAVSLPQVLDAFHLRMSRVITREFS